MKIVYRNILAFIIMIASFTSGLSSDITITINHAINSNNGSIIITLDDNNEGPYTFVLTGPFNTTFTNSNLVNELNTLPVGNYCLLVTNVDGCTAEVCFQIKRCKLFKGRKYCNEIIIMSSPHDGNVMLVGHDDNGDIKNNTFNILADISETQLNEILPSILETTDQQANNILLTGTSPYMVLEQDELADDDILFLFKFDQLGNLEWVYYSGENANPENIDDEIPTRNFKDYHEEIRISPNPVFNSLTVKLNPDRNYESFKIYNYAGQLIIERIIQEESELSINVNTLIKGMYFIQFSGNQGKETKKFIKN